MPGVQGIVGTLRDGAEDRPGTFRDLAGRLLGARLVGAPDQLADQLAAWVEAGIAGVNVMDVPGTARLTVRSALGAGAPAPWMVAAEFTTGTLREKLFGGAARLPARHPAAAPRVRKAA